MTTNDKDIIVKQIRAQLKAEFPECKFSVTHPHYGSIHVDLMQAPFNPFEGENIGEVYAQLNHYQLNDTFNPYGTHCNGYRITRQAWDLMKHVAEIGNADNWDKSDHMTDYHNCNYYFHLAIGKWNKPFVQSEAK